MRARYLLYRAVRTSKYAVLATACATSMLPVFSAAQDKTSAPAKPLRERLLDRAMKGEAEAQFDLAKGYEGGRYGLQQDYAQAFHWYREAAKGNDPFAEATLGIFYASGKGVQRDYVLAYAWFERSASHLKGSDRETVLEKRDSVERRMTPAELKRARSMTSGGEPIPQG